MRIDIKTDELPVYATMGSAGCDLHARIENPKQLQSLDRHTFSTGVKIAIPEGYVGRIEPRSGLAKNNGVVAVTGIIDSDYRGEIGITLVNLSKEPYVVHDGDRIAQLVIEPCVRAEWNEVEELDETERGENGFGHSGK